MHSKNNDYPISKQIGCSPGPVGVSEPETRDPIRDSTPKRKSSLMPSQVRSRSKPEHKYQQKVRRRPRSLREGCYLIRYTPRPQDRAEYPHYDGTMRIERDEENTIASGDLYRHFFSQDSWPSSIELPPEPDPAAGIPIFPIIQYRYYVRVTQILESTTQRTGFTLGFELHRFYRATNRWTNEGSFTALMTWITAPQGYPSRSDYLTGEVKNSSGTVVASLTMGWVCEHFRSAVIEIDRVPKSKAPLDNGSGIDWFKAFDQVGWHIKAIESDSDIKEPDSGGSWSKSELHKKMLERRDSHKLDNEWRYHVLCVRKLDDTPRGLMYDYAGADSNKIPREGVAISSHWPIPNEPKYGIVQGKLFHEATAPYFRTAVHEIGHAMHLGHLTTDDCFMNMTEIIAENATVDRFVEFPNNIQWSFARYHQKMLRHMPDIWVRPGGMSFQTPFWTTPISPEDRVVDADGLALEVSPLLETVPIGAPVRIDFNLINNSDQPIEVPDSLSLKSGHVKGKVIDPAGNDRTFRSVILCGDHYKLCPLDPKKSKIHSLTLLRGAQGALFPSPGLHQIIVEVTWHLNGIELGVSGQTSVMVKPPENDAHAKAALKILSTPDTLLALAIGGRREQSKKRKKAEEERKDYFKEGIEALGAGIRNKVLQPHFAIIEAKRVGNRFFDRKADFERACKLIDDKAILTGSEIKRMAEIVMNQDPKKKTDHGKKLAKILRNKIEKTPADAKIIEMVKKL